MKEYKIYTAGKMAGLEFKEQMDWRLEIDRRVTNELNKKESRVSATFIHPPLFYQHGEHFHKSEKEVKEWDISQVLSSDILVVNTEHVADSTGTHFELAMCDALNHMAGRHIYVIGVGNTDPKNLHPWIADSIMRYEKDFQDAAEYIVDYLLL